MDAAVAFNDAINRRDLDGLTVMMTERHRFVDSSGTSVVGRSVCTQAWQGFFDSFPDYRNVFDQVTEVDEGVVVVLGRSECSVDALRGPAQWRAVVIGGLIDLWQVSVPAVEAR